MLTLFGMYECDDYKAFFLFTSISAQVSMFTIVYECYSHYAAFKRLLHQYCLHVLPNDDGFHIGEMMFRKIDIQTGQTSLNSIN